MFSDLSPLVWLFGDDNSETESEVSTQRVSLRSNFMESPSNNITETILSSGRAAQRRVRDLVEQADDILNSKCQLLFSS